MNTTLNYPQTFPVDIREDLDRLAHEAYKHGKPVFAALAERCAAAEHALQQYESKQDETEVDTLQAKLSTVESLLQDLDSLFDNVKRCSNRKEIEDKIKELFEAVQ